MSELKRNESGEIEVETVGLNPAGIKPGDFMLFRFWGKVKRTNGNAVVAETIGEGREFKAEGDWLLKESASADQYSKTVRVTPTEAVEVLLRSVGYPVTVDFVKKGPPREERRLRGRFKNSVTHEGRCVFEDLEAEDDRPRQVDNRSILRVITRGVMYTVDANIEEWEREQKREARAKAEREELAALRAKNKELEAEVKRMGREKEALAKDHAKQIAAMEKAAAKAAEAAAKQSQPKPESKPEPKVRAKSATSPF